VKTGTALYAEATVLYEAAAEFWGVDKEDMKMWHVTEFSKLAVRELETWLTATLEAT